MPVSFRLDLITVQVKNKMPAIDLTVTDDLVGVVGRVNN